MAEVLYHMSRQAMDVLVNNGPFTEWKNRAAVFRRLVIFRVHPIDNLVYIDTEDCRQQTSLGAKQGIASTLVVHPDQVYRPLQAASTFYRSARKNGIVYPSARHSRGHALALFLDQTARIKRILGTLDIHLALVEEATESPIDRPPISPFDKKLSHTRGYYEITRSDFTKNQNWLNPRLPASRGVIDFVRVPYRKYPDAAVT
jgi:hypothetical protein